MNLDGPVWVAKNAGSGPAKLVVSFENWKGVPVAPTTHEVVVLPAKPNPAPEPVSSNLIGTLVHPQRDGYLPHVRFSPDGRQLLVTGYPSGVIQFWDVETRKEVRRIETASGYRGSSDYAALSPDWKSLYVNVEKRVVKSFESEGKKLWRQDYSGRIRVWDLFGGKEIDPIEVSANTAPISHRLTQDGRYLFYVERPSQEGRQHVPDITMVRDTTTGKQWKLCDQFTTPFLHPDEKTVAVSHSDIDSKSFVRVLEFPSGKELASVACPDADRYFQLSFVSSDGNTLAVALGGKKGAAPQYRFMDSKTLANRGEIITEADPNGHGWTRGIFTPDSKHFVAYEVSGSLIIWNVEEQRVVRKLNHGLVNPSWRQVFGPDGKTLAIGWMPKYDSTLDKRDDPDPQEFPQPRVTLVDIESGQLLRTLIAPHGFVGGLAFSPDGKTLAFGSSGGVHLFDLSKPESE